MIERRESRIETLGSAVIAFYEGSQAVEKDEFVTFNARILEKNQDILNVFVLKNNYVIQSYPHEEFLNKDFDETFQTFPIQVDGRKAVAAEFFMLNDMSVIISAPFDYFVTERDIFHDNYKLILTSSSSNDVLLYEIEKRSGSEFHNGVTLSPEKINYSITKKK
jgi:hypothetical protein